MHGPVTMIKTSTILILVIVAGVNLSNGYSIISPDTKTTSFSGSSASSSAFAHSSSSSYTFDGPIDPNDLEKLKAGALAGATATASATAGAGAFGGSGAGAFAGSSAGSFGGSGIGSFGGSGAGSQAGALSTAGAGAHTSSLSGASVGSGSIAGGGAGHLEGGHAGSDATATSGSVGGCSGGNGGCGGSQDSNQIESATGPVDTGAYKIINTNQYTTGYNSGSQEPNYAVAGPYVRGTAGGCSTCKGPFPGPKGSIHDYKLASSVPVKGHGTLGGSAHVGVGGASKPSLDILPPAPSESNYHETGIHGTDDSDIGSAHISPNLIATFPGPSGSIYNSKPAGAGAGAGAIAGTGSYYSNSGSASNVPSSVGCKYTPGSPNKNCGGSSAGGHSAGGAHGLPGPSGSIHDSKPVHGTGVGAGAASHSGSGTVFNIPSSHPIVGPVCSYTPGSPNKNCGGTAIDSSSGHGTAGTKPILPGTSGSIYDSKPAPSTFGSTTGAGAAVNTGAYSDSGSVSNIPSTHPVVPTCSSNPGSPNHCGGPSSNTKEKYTPGSSAGISSNLPGSSGSIYSSKPASSVPSHSGAGAGTNSVAVAGANAGTYGDSGSVTNIPSSHPVVPACSSNPGSPNYCAGPSSNNKENYTPGSSGGIASNLPGSSGSIYSSKPASSVPSHSGAGAGINSVAVAGTNAGTYSDSGSVTSIPSSHPVVPACSSNPGSPNYCAGPSSNTKEKYTPGSSAGIASNLPGSTGSIYSSKPAHSGAGAGTYSGSGAASNSGTYSNSGSVTNIPSSHPVAPACSYNPGTPNYCGGTVFSPTKENSTPGSSSGIASNLPGPSGSIYSSKPINSVPSYSGAVAGTNSVSGTVATAGSYGNSGSVTNIPSSHPVAPACSYNPGSPNYCGGTVVTTEQKNTPGSSASIAPILPGPSGSIYSSKPASSATANTGVGAGSISASVAGAGANAGSGTHSSSGSVSNIPSTHQVVGPICTYSPGSPNKCGNGNVPQNTGVSGASASGGATAVALAGCISCKGPFPGPNGSIHDYKVASFVTSGVTNEFHSGSGAYGANLSPSFPFGCKTCNGPFPGPKGSIHDYKPASIITSGATHGFHIGSGAQGAILSPSFGSHLSTPSIHAELPSSPGTYYINKQKGPSKDTEASLSVPSFSGQIPCSDSTCGSEISNHASGSVSGAYFGVQSHGSGANQHSGVVFVDKDTSDLHKSIGHDEAHKSGGVVFENGDGSYHNIPTSKSTYKNAVQGGYAVNSDEAENTGFLIGPGTGNLPIEGEDQPFGTQGAFGGSVGFAKSVAQSNANSFGTGQGTLGGSGATDDKPHGSTGGSASFAKSSSSAHSSENQFIYNRPCALGDCRSSFADNKDGFATGGITIQKYDGSSVTPNDNGSYKPCSNGACSSGFESGPLVKLECTGASCGDTEVYIVEDKPGNFGSHSSNSGSGCSSGSCGGSGSGNGFATGQVLVQKGNGATYDATNHGAGANGAGSSYSGSSSGAYNSGNQYVSSGCITGRCGGSGFGVGGSLGIDNSGGILNKLFGGGLSGTLNKLGGNGFGASNAYSNSGSYSGASAENQFTYNRPCALGDCRSSFADNKDSFAPGGVTIQKYDGSSVTPNDDGSYKPCSNGACSSGFESGPLVKLECTGASCGDTEVYIVEDKPGNFGSHSSNSGSGCSSGSCGGSGSGNGFATGQVLVQKGHGATYDATNHGAGANGAGSSYSGSSSGAYNSGNQYVSSGCITGRCGGSGFGVGGSLGIDNSGGILNKLFGSGGLSGTLNKLGGNGFGASNTYSNSGSYSGASAGGFASASASAHAGSFAHSF